MFKSHNIPCAQFMTTNDDKNAQAELQYLRIGSGTCDAIFNDQLIAIMTFGLIIVLLFILNLKFCNV